MRHRIGRLVLVATLAILGACSSDSSSTGSAGSSRSAPTDVTSAGAGSLPPIATSTTSTVAVATVPSTTTVAPTTSTTMAPTTTARPTTTRYVLPVPADVKISYAHTHSGYTATDIFAATGCGTPLLSPVDGQVLQTRRVDNWTKKANNPALRGGLSVAVLGNDGVRYYLAHLQEIDPTVQPGVDVTAGERLGEMGRSGDAAACHLHFGISMPCPGLEWSIRRGIVWPWPYLDSWRAGGQLSPALEIVGWALAHPDACTTAMADKDAAISG